MELSTEIYNVQICKPSVVIVTVCKKLKRTYVCNTKINERFIKKCVGKAITSYVLGGE